MTDPRSFKIARKPVPALPSSTNDEIAPVRRDVLETYSTQSSASTGSGASRNRSDSNSDLLEGPTRTNVVKDSPKKPTVTYWNSFFLKRTSLLLLILVLAMMFVALEVLAAFSDRNRGLSTTVSRHHYLWTYGPTAGMDHRILFHWL